MQVGKGRSVGAGPGVILPLVQVSTNHVEEAAPRAPCRALCVPRVLSDTDSENFKSKHIMIAGRPGFYGWESELCTVPQAALRPQVEPRRRPGRRRVVVCKGGGLIVFQREPN
jgi:hypothetical protein